MEAPHNSPESIRALVESISEASPRRHREITAALEALGPKAEAVLRESLDHPNWQVRVTSAQLLGKAGEQNAMVLIEALRRPNAPAAAIAEALAMSGEAVFPLLLQALSDPCASVRETCAKALRNKRDPRAIAPLARLAAGDRDFSTRLAAAEALYAVDDPEAQAAADAFLARCIAELDSGNTGRVRRVVTALELLGRRSAMQPLLALRSRADEPLCHEVNAALRSVRRRIHGSRNVS